MAGEANGGSSGAGAGNAGTGSGVAGGGSAAAGAGAGAAGTGPGASTGNPAGAAGTPPASAGGHSAPPDWTTGFNDDHKGFVGNKGWKNPSEVVDSYRNLEKLVGAPQDQILKLPKSDAEAAEWEPVYNRLGRPATPDAYKLEVPKDGNPEFAKWASEQFHKEGLSEKQGQNIVKKWNEYMANTGRSTKEAYSAKIQGEQVALKKEWGAAYDQNIAVAQRAAREFGVDPKVISSIESSAGFNGTMKLFQAIGSKLGDANFHGGNGGNAGGGALTPAQARDQIKALKGDPGFAAKYIAGDHGARQKMENLHKFAYPDA